MEQQILTLINQTHKNIFLTGKAGTGKTTLLGKIVKNSHKNMVVVAPTGIAALNAGGVTIHSMFQLPFASFLPTSSNPPMVSGNSRFENQISLRKHFKMHKNKRKIIENLELLVVDEVSMLRADVLDAMDFMLRSIRKNKSPFGGVQVLFIGDLLQLPPVVKNEEWEILKQYYKGMFFFQSKVITENPLLYVELEKIYRQSDQVFINLLNNLRNNQLTDDDIKTLQPYLKPDFKSTPESGFITLTTHNVKAEAINNREMNKLKTKEFMYEASVVGDFPENMYPIEKQIFLKKGARVMFVKNDLSGERLYFNGKMGTILSLEEQQIEVLLDGGKIIDVEPYEWENIRYRINEQTKEIEEERLGTFSQYPLRLAWAITVHKSQGLTFEKAVLDLDNVFAAGQAYVAFSRLRSLDGLVLLSPIDGNGIDNDENVQQYAQNKASQDSIAQACETGKKTFLENSLLNCFDWNDFKEQWQQHKDSYLSLSGSKSNYKNWVDTQFDIVTELVGFAQKFSLQLNQIFTSNYDFSFVHQRFENAYGYFLPRLKNIWFEILSVEAQCKILKNTKQFRDELSELDDATAYVVRILLKTQKMMQLAKNQISFNKENINSDDLIEIKSQLLIKVKEHLKDRQLFVNEQDTESKQHNKKEKLSTYEITLQLWKSGKSVAEIAQMRMFTEATIYRHLMKLIEMNKVDISEVLSKETIDALTAVFDQNQDIALGNIYEACQGKYSWDELRLFKSQYLKNYNSEK